MESAVETRTLQLILFCRSVQQISRERRPLAPRTIPGDKTWAYFHYLPYRVTSRYSVSYHARKLRATGRRPGTAPRSSVRQHRPQAIHTHPLLRSTGGLQHFCASCLAQFPCFFLAGERTAGVSERLLFSFLSFVLFSLHFFDLLVVLLVSIRHDKLHKRGFRLQS